MTILTGVSAHFSAAHRDDGDRLHGHTWDVVAWFNAGGDACDWQSLLVNALAAFDHTELPDHLSRGEDLVVAIAAALPSAVEIEIRRPLERIYAKWKAA